MSDTGKAKTGPVDTRVDTRPPGSIFNKGGRWYWKVRLDGKRRTLALRPTGAPFATRERRVAEAIRRRMWADLRAGATPTTPRTPQALIEEYEAANRMSASTRQAAANRKCLERFFLRIPSVQSATSDEVQAYLQALSTPRKEGGGGLSPATVYRHRNALGKFYRWLHRKGVVDASPVDLSETPRVYHRPPRHLDRLARRALLRAVRAVPWLRRAVLMALTSGLRLGEIRALRWSAVHGRRLVVGDEAATKTNAWRVVPLRVPLGPRGAPDERVFPDNSAEVWVDSLRDAAKGVPLMFSRTGRGGVGNGWHLLRSTWATRCAARGMTLWELMRLGGWRVPQTVMRYVSLAGKGGG